MVEALINSDLLVWARESAGFTVADAAKKAQVKPEALIQWELGAGRPSIPQLRKLANVYKRPLAVFYLPERPKTFDAMHDFRRLPGEVAGKQSPELRRAIRQVRLRRQVALDLYRELEGEPPEFTLTAALNDDPEAVGQRVRDFLGVAYEAQTSWRGDYEAFNIWRASLESRGVVVFQIEDVDTDEMRGLSISEAPLPAVVLNISDTVRARIFSLAHEATHLALRDGGLCDLDEDNEAPAASSSPSTPTRARRNCRTRSM
jgi:transcriptional regulator with XRE-family HTH domain